MFDELIHASIYDGIKLGYATHYKFKHNNVDSLRELIHRHHSNFKTIYIAVESVYSMDGDIAPLVEIVELISLILLSLRLLPVVWVRIRLFIAKAVKFILF